MSEFTERLVAQVRQLQSVAAGMHACREACREMRRMVEAINADRAARGIAPLDVEIQVPGEV